MTPIFSGLAMSLIAGILTTFVVDSQLNGMADVAFHIENNITTLSTDPNAASLIFSSFNAATKTFYGVGISLIVLKFLIKGFTVYSLWADGDPEADPCGYLVNFIKAIIVATCFPIIYDFVTKIASQMVVTTTGAITAAVLDPETMTKTIKGFGFIPQLMFLIYMIMWVVLYFKFIMRGAELMLMRVGVSFACIGLLDNDKGVFAGYSMMIAKAIFTTIVQVLCLKISMSLALGAEVFNIGLMVIGMAFIMLANSLPKLLGEFMVPSGSGGGALASASHISQITRTVASFVKK